MNLYLITQDDVEGYDTFSAAVVAAENEEDARTIHPSMVPDVRIPILGCSVQDGWFSGWTNDPSKVHVTLLGVAVHTIDSSRVICASFHAG